MGLSRFKVMGQFECGGLIPATITIDRTNNLFSVRPYKRHRTYDLPLSAVAEMVKWRVTKAELMQAKREKKNKRRGK